MPNSILITGANGFLGHYLCNELLGRGHSIVATARGACRLPFQEKAGFTYREMDFTNAEHVQQVMSGIIPSVVVHAGAISQPDICEQDQERAFLFNVTGTINLISAAEKFGSFFLFVSTDFVFSGEEDPYQETDERNPVNYYGFTKMKAEDEVQGYEANWSIVRPVLVYGQPQTGRSNLLTVVRDHLQAGRPYNVFDDQLRTPTYVEDLAWAIAEIIETKLTGIFHISGEDEITPYGMARAVADKLALDGNLIRRVTSKDMKQAARRPRSTRMIIEKSRTMFNYQPRTFEEGLSRTFI